MDEIVTNVYFQSAIAPFLVSLIVGLMLRSLGWRWAAFSGIAGFAMAVYLITDFQLFPLRSDRKIVLAFIVAVIVGVLLDLMSRNRHLMLKVLFISSACVALWLLWPRFRLVGGWDLWTLAIGGSIYVGWLVAVCDELKNRPMEADNALLALALGTGISTLLGATALYGQLGSAIAAAVGARWLLRFMGKAVPTGMLMILPLTLTLALLGIGAVAYAKLPWYSLVMLALIPLMVRVPVTSLPVPIKPLYLNLILALVPALLAILFTWAQRGSPLM